LFSNKDISIDPLLMNQANPPLETSPPKTANILLTSSTHMKNEISFGGVHELFVNSGIDSLFDNSVKPVQDNSMAVNSPAEIERQVLHKSNDNDPEQAKQRLSMMSTGSEPEPVDKIMGKTSNGKPEEKSHNRGPSFQLRDMFRTHYSDDEEDDTPSITSVPDEDYFAIRAYYDLEAGSDSRRSSFITGDYGRIVSRRVSKRLSQQHGNKQMSEIFDINITTPRVKPFQDFGKTPIIKEEEEENTKDDLSLMENPSKHQKKDTYSAVRAMFEPTDIWSDNEQVGDVNDKNTAKNQYKIAVTPDGHVAGHPSTNIPLALSFDWLAERSPDPTITPPMTAGPIGTDLLHETRPNELVKEDSNDKKKQPIKTEENTKKEENIKKEESIKKEEEKMKMKEQLAKELKEDWEKTFYIQMKSNVEKEIKKQYEERMRSEEAEFKSETLRLEEHVKELKQDLNKAETQNKRLKESKIALIATTSEEINALRDTIWKMGKLKNTRIAT